MGCPRGVPESGTRAVGSAADEEDGGCVGVMHELGRRATNERLH